MSIALKSDYHDRLAGLFTHASAASLDNPTLIRVNGALANAIGLDLAGLDEAACSAFFSGQFVPKTANPIALGYAGHQFGQFTPQLGDGRAMLLGEVEDAAGRLWDIQLKGSGRTDWSRGGDGYAALGPVLREYLMAEAMHAIGVPTTRALAAVSTGMTVYRETGTLPGAMLTRVASSHIRIGTFQFYAAHGEVEKLQRLFDYTLARHYPDAAQADDPRLALLDAYVDRLAQLVAWWMSIGFVHGVMNTDNMTLSGETIDYGPCAFIDIYDPAACFSSIDATGRYAYANQPAIAQWNLARFAETLLLLGLEPGEKPGEADIQPFADLVQGFTERYETALVKRISLKLGLLDPNLDTSPGLVRALFGAMEGNQVDFTGFFRSLSEDVRGVPDAPRALFANPAAYERWAADWRGALAREGRATEIVTAAMDRANPLYIPRNHKIEEALVAARDGDYGPWEHMLTIVTAPYAEQPGAEDFAKPAPTSFGKYVTFCGT